MTWRAEPNTQYWIVGFDLIPRAQVDTRSDEDNGWYEVGNYFQYRTTAVKAAKCFRATLGFVRGETDLETVVERLLTAKKALKETNEGGSV
jgi:hypothetical protein